MEGVLVDLESKAAAAARDMIAQLEEASKEAIEANGVERANLLKEIERMGEGGDISGIG